MNTKEHQNNHTELLSKLDTFFQEKNYKPISTSIYSLEHSRIISLIKIRKHTMYNGYFIDFGIIFKDIEYSSLKSEPSWHLRGNLGMFNPSFKKAIEPDLLTENEINQVLVNISDSTFATWESLVYDTNHSVESGIPPLNEATLNRLQPNSIKVYDRIQSINID